MLMFLRKILATLCEGVELALNRIAIPDIRRIYLPLPRASRCDFMACRRHAALIHEHEPLRPHFGSYRS